MRIARIQSALFSYLVLVGILFSLYHLPTIWLGEDAYFNAFDTLDCYVVWYKMVLAAAPLAPSDTIIPQIMGGLPKYTLVDPCSLYYALNYLLPTFTAFVSHQIFISLVGLWGMYRLARRNLSADAPTASLLALSYGLHPYLVVWSLSIAGLPLLLSAFLSIRNRRDTWADWLVFFVYPFASNLQSSGVFVMLAMAAILTLDIVKKKEVVRAATPLLILGILYLVTKQDLIGQFIAGNSFVSHRAQMLRVGHDLFYSIKIAGRYFLLGSPDVNRSLHLFTLLPIVILTVATHYRRIRSSQPLILQLAVAVVLICGVIGFLDFRWVAQLRNSVPILKMYSMERIHILLPLLWHILAALCLNLIQPILRRRVVISAIAVQWLVALAFQPTYYKLFFQPWYTISGYENIYTYRNYYAQSLFDQLKSEIPSPLSSQRVACVGFPPAIAQYNGLYTVDGYASNYPLAYKKRFRKVIARELSKNTDLAFFFDHWGNQCYMFYDQGTGTYNSYLTRHSPLPAVEPSFDLNALAELDCTYVLSSFPLSGKSGLSLIGHYQSELWDFYLYKILI